jgi:hypothetical protein
VLGNRRNPQKFTGPKLLLENKIRDAQAPNRKPWRKRASLSTTACGFLRLLPPAKDSRTDCANPKKLSQIRNILLDKKKNTSTIGAQSGRK